jgi:hypothetical protein
MMQAELGYGPPPHYKLESYLMKNYNHRLLPRRDNKRPVDVWFRISLYQIVEVVRTQLV